MGALYDLQAKVVSAVERGTSLVILSDRNVSTNQIAIPSLLATSAVHHKLIEEGCRTRCSLIIESGEPREVHHFVYY